MIVKNIISKLEKVGVTNIKIDAQMARGWDGWNIILTARIGRYYDVKIHEQINKYKDIQTVEQAINKFKNSDIGYYAVKPWHDEDDMQSDYHAYHYSHKLKDIEQYAQWANDEKRRLAPESGKV